MEWIKCSDRLPEIDKKVLTLIENSRVIGEFIGDEWIEHYWIDIPKKRFMNSYSDLQQYVNENITHWMPLPEIPKE